MFTSIFSELLLLNTQVFLQWLYIDYSELLLVFLLTIATWNTLVVVSFRYKVYYFLVTLALLAIWGFSASFDGLILMMLITEVSVAVFFIFLFITAKFKKEHTGFSNKLVYIHMLISFLLLLSTVDTGFSTFFLFFNNVYPYINDIVSHDLLIVYMFVLFFNPLVTVHISVLLGLFSLFFICVFFTIKHLKNSPVTSISSNKNSTEFLVIRRQLMFQQSIYNSRIRTFQKK